MSNLGDIGCGAGKSGGGGGTIREAGGAFGKLEAAREEMYFHNIEVEQLKKLSEQLKNKEQQQQLKPLTEAERLIAARNEQMKNMEKNVE